MRPAKTRCCSASPTARCNKNSTCSARTAATREALYSVAIDGHGELTIIARPFFPFSHKGRREASPPVQQPRFEPVDQLADREPEQRQDDDAGQKLVGLHQIAGLQYESADAEFGADHFGADHQQ